MLIRVGFEIDYHFPQPTPLILMLSVHHSRVSDLVVPDHLFINPSVPSSAYRDSFGNWCMRLVAPSGPMRISADAQVRDHGQREIIPYDVPQTPVEYLPEETLVYLLGSRYCETEKLAATAWQLFGNGPTGGARVQAVCDYVHNHIRFGYAHARPSKTAYEAWQERAGVCRDFAHLALTLCRCLNIPARYCAGYLGDIGVPPMNAPMDFAGWFEAFLDGRWYTFDARNNTPRIGRILMSRGRDAADVAITTTFGPHSLNGFRVWTDEIVNA